MDGATPIVVIDTDDILLSLQKATLQNKESNKEAQETEKLEEHHSKCNGTNGA